MYFFLEPPSFCENTLNKRSGIEVLNGNTLFSRSVATFAPGNIVRGAIADDPIDAKADGKKIFCARVDMLEKSIAAKMACRANEHRNSELIIGLTPLEVFDASNENCFAVCGLNKNSGFFHLPRERYHKIIDMETVQAAQEIVVILNISNNGEKKEIRFLCDGSESKTEDVSEYLKGDLLFPAFILAARNQQITTISIDQIQKRTPEIDELINELEHQRFRSTDFFVQVRNEISSLSSQLQQEQQKAKEQDQLLQQEQQKNLDLQRENQQLKQENEQLKLLLPPFLAEKPFLIDLARNGVTAPNDTVAF
jgi:hypothetical protein